MIGDWLATAHLLSRRYSVPCMALVVVGLLLLAGCARSPEATKARHLERGDRFFEAARYREAMIEYRKALRIESTNPRAIQQLGLSLYEVGEWQSAYRALLRAQKLVPDNVDVRLKLGVLYLQGGRPEDAGREAIAVLDRQPSNLDALALLVGSTQTREDFGRALKRIQAAPAELRGKARFHIIVADLHLRRGDAATAERVFQEAVARDPESLDARSALGMYYALKGDKSRADREFEIVRERTPDDPARRVRLADFYVMTRRPQEARQVLSELTDKAPDFMPAWRRRATLDLENGRHDEALRALDVIIKKNPGDLDAHVLRGRAFLGKRMPAQAVHEFQQTLRREPKLPAVRYLLAQAHLQGRHVHQAKGELRETLALDPGFLRARLLLAQVNLSTGAGQAVIEDLEPLMTTPSPDPRVYVLLGSAYLAKRQPRRAIETYQKLTNRAPAEPLGPFLVGLALRVEGKHAEARRAFEAALSRAPTYGDALVQLVSIEFADKRADTALARVRQQVTLAPRAGELRYILGAVHQARREWDLAEAAYLEAIQYDPKLTAGYVALGRLYARRGKDEQAMERALAAVKADATNVPALMLVGTLHERRGEIPKAQEAYERVLGVSPRFAPAANNLAYLHIQHRGDKERASQLAQLAHDVAPDDPYVADTLGWVLYQRGMPERALGLLQESARKLPDNVEVLYHLGMTAAKLGDKDLARRALTRVASAREPFGGQEEAVKTLAGLSKLDDKAGSRASGKR